MTRILLFLSAAAIGLAQQQIVVLTPPALPPYNLSPDSTPVADSFTVGTQLNGQLETAVPLLLTSDSRWLSLNSDCTTPGAATISVSTTAVVEFCVDPSQTAGAGYYVALIQITAPFNNGYSPLVVPVNLTRFPTGDLSPNPASVSLTSTQLTAAASISEDPNGLSAQGQPVTVTAQLGQPNPPEGPWLQFSLKNATVKQGAPGEIDIQANPANLVSQDPAQYLRTLVITDNHGDTKPITVSFTVKAAAAAQSVRSFAHIAPQPSFGTQIILTNTSGQALNFSLEFFHDDGSAFSVPVTSANGAVTESSIVDTIAPYGTNYYELSNASSDASNIWGSAQLTAPSSVIGVALFRNVPNAGSYFEAAVPLSAGSTSFIAPFDETTSSLTNQQFVNGFAVANLDSSNAASVNCTARNSAGSSISSASLSLTLPPNGHTARVLSNLTGTRGTLTCTSTTNVSAVSLRFLGNEFTTLPVVPTP
jgi:hypothetical protein